VDTEGPNHLKLNTLWRITEWSSCLHFISFLYSLPQDSERRENNSNWTYG